MTFIRNGEWSCQFNCGIDVAIYIRTVRKRSGNRHNLVRLRNGSRYGTPRHKIVTAEAWAGIEAIIAMGPDAYGVLCMIEQDMRVWGVSKAKTQFEHLIPVLKQLALIPDKEADDDT